MATINQDFTVNFNVDATLVWAAEEYLVNYLTDIPLRGLGGEKLDDEVIEEKIKVATEQIENMMSIKVPKQFISETQDFERDQFSLNWGFIKTNHLITEAYQLEGRLNFANVIVYPVSWISIDRSDPKRNISIVAGQDSLADAATTTSFIAVFTGQFPIWRSINSDHIPNYWRICYTTGFDEMPKDLADAIGKVASTQILAILGDVAFGAGIASKSISIDGLSQSINTTQSAENSLYSARIRQFEKELKNELKWLRNKYNSPSIMAL